MKKLVDFLKKKRKKYKFATKINNDKYGIWNF